MLAVVRRIVREIDSRPDGRMGWVRLTKQMIRECGHYPHETQEFVNAIKSIRGVRVTVLLRELETDPRIKSSRKTSSDMDGAVRRRRPPVPGPI